MRVLIERREDWPSAGRREREISELTAPTGARQTFGQAPAAAASGGGAAASLPGPVDDYKGKPNVLAGRSI